MKVFRIDKMCVHAGRDGGDRWIQKPLFGVGEERLSQNKEYEIILNPGYSHRNQIEEEIR